MCDLERLELKAAMIALCVGSGMHQPMFSGDEQGTKPQFILSGRQREPLWQSGLGLAAPK